MRDEKQLQNFKTFAKISTLYSGAFLTPKEPVKVAEEILYFRDHYQELDLSKVKFYTYILDHVDASLNVQKAIKVLWERDNEEWAAHHEVTLSVYPAMTLNDDGEYILNFYFIPTWVEKTAKLPLGKHIQGKIIDFVDILKPDSPYPNSIGYIYDLGSSCP